MTDTPGSPALRSCTLCGATVFPTTRACEFCGNIVEQREEDAPPAAAVAMERTGYGFEAVVAAILVLSTIYIVAVIGRTHPMLSPFFRLGVAWMVTSFSLAIAVVLDANRRRIAAAQAARNLAPEQWFAVTLAAWPAALPYYCAARRPERGRNYFYGWIVVAVLFVTMVLITLGMLKRNYDRFYPPQDYRRGVSTAGRASP